MDGRSVWCSKGNARVPLVVRGEERLDCRCTISNAFRSCCQTAAAELGQIAEVRLEDGPIQVIRARMVSASRTC